MKGMVIYMTNTKKYNIHEICEYLNISSWTLLHWYDLEKKQLKDGLIDKPYLPVPERLTNVKGRPKMWTQEMADALKEYQSNIIMGRNGIYGVYSNPNHYTTRKYQKNKEVKN